MRRILACIDLAESHDLLLACARDLAGEGGEILLLHVAQPEPEFLGYSSSTQTVRDEVAGDLRKEHKTAQSLAATLRETGVSASALTVQGTIVERILEHAERLQSSFIVLSSHGHWAVHDLIVKSVVRGVIKGARVPVVVVPLGHVSEESK